jgi:hypothetical protein
VSQTIPHGGSYVDRLNLKAFASRGFFEDFKYLAGLDPDQLRLMAQYLNTEDGFGPRSDDELAELVAKIGRPAEDVSCAIRISKALYDLAVEKDASTQEVVSELRAYADAKGIPISDQQQESWTVLFGISQKYVSRRNVSAYREASLRLLAGITVVHDLRAVFTKTKTDYEGLLPVYVARVSTKDQDGEKETFSFQLGEKGIEVLLQSLQKAKDQLASVKERLKQAGVAIVDDSGPEAGSGI